MIVVSVGNLCSSTNFSFDNIVADVRANRRARLGADAVFNAVGKRDKEVRVVNEIGVTAQAVLKVAGQEDTVGVSI